MRGAEDGGTLFTVYTVFFFFYLGENPPFNTDQQQQKEPQTPLYIKLIGNHALDRRRVVCCAHTHTPSKTL